MDKQQKIEKISSKIREAVPSLKENFGQPIIDCSLCGGTGNNPPDSANDCSCVGWEDEEIYPHHILMAFQKGKKNPQETLTFDSYETMNFYGHRKRSAAKYNLSLSFTENLETNDELCELLVNVMDL